MKAEGIRLDGRVTKMAETLTQGGNARKENTMDNKRAIEVAIKTIDISIGLILDPDRPTIQKSTTLDDLWRAKWRLEALPTALLN